MVLYIEYRLFFRVCLLVGPALRISWLVGGSDPRSPTSLKFDITIIKAAVHRIGVCVPLRFVWFYSSYSESLRAPSAGGHFYICFAGGDPLDVYKRPTWCVLTNDTMSGLPSYHHLGLVWTQLQL